MTRNALRPLLAALVAVGAVLTIGLLGPATTRPTSAAWTDPVHARATVEIDATLAPEVISAGTNFTCGVVDGASWCWGLGETGPRGTGSTARADVPVPTVAGAMGDLAITGIDAGTGRTCATAGAQAFCWGQGGGSLGNLDATQPWSSPDSLVPVAVYAGSSADGLPYSYDSPLLGQEVVQTTVGDAMGCAIVASGTGGCWGNQVGFPRPTDPNDPRNWANAPIPIPTSGILPRSEFPPGVPITHVTTDFNTGCLIAGGEAYCWGVNQEGQVGSGEQGDPVDIPTTVETGEMTTRPVTDIATGRFHTCALAGGSVYCWGLRASGQIGDTTDQGGSSLAPQQAALPEDVVVTDIAAGGSTSCALTTDGLVYCWGNNQYGQIGNNSMQNAMLPVPVDTSLLPDDVTFTAVTVGATHVCALGSDDEVYCWGETGTLGTGAGQTTALRPEVPVTQSWAGAP